MMFWKIVSMLIIIWKISSIISNSVEMDYIKMIYYTCTVHEMSMVFMDYGSFQVLHV